MLLWKDNVWCLLHYDRNRCSACRPDRCVRCENRQHQMFVLSDHSMVLGLIQSFGRILTLQHMYVLVLWPFCKGS
jgi:hypothetical protein